MDKVTSVHVEVREWRDKTYGSTYQSARVSANGKWVFSLGLQYGYGDQIIYNAVQELAKRGLVVNEEHRAPSYSLREQGIALYVSKSSVLKREMFKASEPEEGN